MDEGLQLYEKETQVFSCEYCEIFKNSFLYRTPPVTTFDTAKPTKRIVPKFSF